MKNYFLNLFYAVDQLLNAFFGGNPIETICLRAARAWKENKKWGCVLCKVFDFFNANHCHIIAWKNNLDDMPETENYHVSQLPLSETLAVVMIVSFITGILFDFSLSIYITVGCMLLHHFFGRKE